MILYTDKIPDTPDECLFAEPTPSGVCSCVLTWGRCALEPIPGKDEPLKCNCLGLLPDMPVHRCHCGS